MSRIPTAGQFRWLDAELGMFCHFGINTFYDKEWSDGTLSPAGFNPTDFDARSWAQLARAGGFRYLMLTAKHHDGFCLWPTATTDYSVKSSPWRSGQGDIVAEVAEACRAAGVALGLYLSPWDRHEPCYRDAAAYDRFYARQLTELCTRYGPLFEVWFDGAGSEGRTYDWPGIMDVVYKHQPGAMVFNMGRPTIRWVGNEDGLASDPNPLCVTAVSKSVYTRDTDLAGAGMVCLPAECDVAIRRNWFWHPDDLGTLKTREHLLAIYYRSVGLGSNLLLNFGPDTRGRIPETDRDRWLETWAEIQRRFRQPMEACLTPGGTMVELDFGREITLDHLVLEEDLAAGQKVFDFTVRDQAGREIARGHTIGHKRILVPGEVRATKLTVALDDPQARLQRAVGYLTGCTQMPQPGARLDYGDEWAAKVMK